MCNGNCTNCSCHHGERATREKINQMIAQLSNDMPYHDFQTLRHKIIDEIDNWEQIRKGETK